MAPGNPSSESPFPFSPSGPGSVGGPPASADGSPGEITAEVALQFAGLVFSKPEEGLPAIDLRSTPPAGGGGRRRSTSPAPSWPVVILGSYSSAVTLALVWVLATGKTLPRFQARVSNRAPEARASVAPAAPAAADPAPTPPDGVVALGETLTVGDLQVMPLTILHRTVRVSGGAGLDGPSWENPDCLVLTLRLKNTSKERAVTPLEPPTARADGAAAGSRIELGTNRRLSMLGPDLEGDWVIGEQTFPTIAPGASADVVLVSEPAPLERLAGPSMWWVELKTGAEASQTIGVRFSRRDIAEAGGW